MYCTVKEIIREVLDTDVPDSECVFAVVLTRGDVRHIAQDWNLSDDELETVMQRLENVTRSIEQNPACCRQAFHRLHEQCNTFVTLRDNAVDGHRRNNICRAGSIQVSSG